MQSNTTIQDDFNGKLTAIQERAIVALLSHSTMKGAARAVGVDETTLWRWLQDKDFHAAYMNVRREAVKQSIARLQQASTEAVSTLKTIMKDKTAPAASRVMAAKSVIEYSISEAAQYFRSLYAQYPRLKGQSAAMAAYLAGADMAEWKKQYGWAL